MFKRQSLVRILTIAVCLTSVFVLSTSGLALGASTPKSLSTNFTVVNLGPTDTTVTVQYLKDNGNPWPGVPDSDKSFTVPGRYGSVQVRQYFATTMEAGQGSVVVSSSSPLGAVVQIQARPPQVPSMGAYSGFTTGSTKFYVPLAARQQMTASGLANSQIAIQNAGSAATNVTVDLYQGATKTYTKDITGLAPGVSFMYDLDTETNLPAPWIGSAVVTGVSGPITVVSNFFTGPDALQSFNGFPQESIGPKWVAPLFFSRLGNGLSTVVTVQNLSTSQIAAAGLSLSCTKDATTFPAGSATFTVTNPDAIGPNESYSFNPVTNSTMFPEAQWGGSCRIDAGSANVVAIVQMRYVGGSFAGAAAYEAIPEGTTDKAMIVPLVAKRLPNGFASVVTIQNMSTSADAHVTLTYTPSFIAAECPVDVCDKNGDGTVNAADAITVSGLTIPAGGSIQRNHRIAAGAGAETTLPDKWQGSLLVTSSDQPINGFIQLTNFINLTGDTFMAHNAFTQPTALP